jgi:type III pantothenate kinase
LQRDSLIQNTKGIKIPDSAFDNLKPGHNTVDAVHHGILLGLISTIDQIMHHSPKHLILTGGDANLFAKFLGHYQPQVEPDLLLKGLKHYVQLSSTLSRL